MLTNVHIVLVNTSHPGNIGSTARAMKVMGFKKLLLVNPKTFPSPEADALSVGCKDVLENAEVYTSLSKAIENNIVNIGLSARSRKATIPSLHIDDCVDLIIKNSNITYNLIFGNESSGLSNEDLLKCDYILTLPTDKEYTSLNLAASVQILVYELFKNSFKSKLNNKKLSTLAKSKEKNYFLSSLINLMIETGFITDKNTKSLTKKIHILFNKSNLETDEVNMLMGMLNSITKKLNK